MKQIRGQMSIDEYLKERPVEIMDLCDDAFCPECGDYIDEFKWMDCERCPYCWTKISWEPWHRMNDELNQELFGDNWREKFGKNVKKTKEAGSNDRRTDRSIDTDPDNDCDNQNNG